MIRKLLNGDIDRVADIWLKANLKAHYFISNQYWKSNYELVKEMMSQSEVYVFEVDKMIQGFVAYGLSIYFYVYAQRLLGAARTSAYYAVAPFIAAILSLIIFREIPDVTYFVALVLMIVGAWLSSQDKPLIRKVKNE